MTEFFSETVTGRVGKPVKKLLKELVRVEKKSNRKATQSDVLRIAVIHYGRLRLGVKADRILAKGVQVK